MSAEQGVVADVEVTASFSAFAAVAAAAAALAVDVTVAEEMVCSSCLSQILASWHIVKEMLSWYQMR